MEGNERDLAVKIALSMYANEPCRICGQTITNQDVKNAVYAGYGDDGRSAHERCWEGMVKIANELLEAGSTVLMR